MATLDPIPPKTLSALAWPDLLEQVAKRCHTDRGKELAVSLPLLSDPEAIQRELDLVSEARKCHDEGKPLPFGSVTDLRPSLRRLEKEGILEGSTLLLIAQTLQAGSRLSRFLQARTAEAPGLAQLASRIKPLDDLAATVFETFDERGALVDDASPDLGRLRRRVVELHEQLTRRMRAMMEEPRIAAFLQDKFYTQREERYVLPIRTDAGPAVAGIVHGSSASGATIFVEPEETIGLNNQLKVAELEVTREELRILADLSEMVRGETKAIQTNLELLELLDLVNARARLARRLDAHPGRIPADGKVRLLAMRHPLMVLADKAVVPNDLELTPNQALIVTGPNAGGKTVCLKTLGLCCLMLRAGMHLPAGPDSELPIFASVLTEMGDDQSIEHNLSTFTAHLSHLMDFLQRARRGSLILLDEIAIGTDPGEGAALAQSLLEAFARTGAQVVVTTHYERLKSLPLTDPALFANASVGFDLQQMQPTYRLHLGTPGSSGALAVARRLGLPPALVDRASKLLDQGSQEFSRLLTGLAGERAALEKERLSLAEAQAEAQRAAAAHRSALERLREKQQEAMQTEHALAIDELKMARSSLERVRALLRRPPTDERVKQADRQISAAAERIIRHERNQAPLQGRPPVPSELSPGTRVLVQRLGGEGEVIQAPERGKVLVRVGAVRTRVALDDVLLPREAKAAPQRARRPTPPHRAANERDGERTPAPVTPIRTDSNTLDIRGRRVDEALAELDKFLDDALRAEEPSLLIIHGHGTGALRAGVREHLQEQDFVQRFESAGPREGGDGVTVVWLK